MEVQMAFITNIALSATKVTGAGDSWRLTVTYDAVFSKFEIDNFTFRDGFVVWEEDPVDDDKLTGVVGVSVFNPSASPTRRTLTTTISGDTLDTELGQEEIYTVVRLRNLDLNILWQKKSSVLTLSP
jgi:hypothetical protein